MTELPAQEDELDLAELGLLVWSHKLLIVLVICCTTTLAVVFAQSRIPTYQAVAIFELQGRSGGSRLPSEYAGLASIAGLSIGGGESKGVFDRLQGRDFIERITGDIGLANDPFFVPEVTEPGLVDRVKQMLGMDIEPVQERLALDQIADVYQENIEASETPNGSIQIEVTHTDAQRAAVIANGIVTRLLAELSQEDKDEQRDQLEYLSDQLANALADTERTKKSVADFALANSLSSQQAFTARSQAMYELREDLSNTREMLRAVNILSEILKQNRTPSEDDFLNLRQQAPVVDDVDFRRLLGVPEALDSWRWPPVSRLGGFSFTLKDRAARIERSIDKLHQEAERYASSTETLAGLQRESNVAEATYNVLIEQVKARSLASGYQANLARIYQSASPPDLPASPNKVLIVALGVVLGGLLGAGIAILLGKSSGRIYSANVMRDTASAVIDLEVPSFAKFKSNVFERKGTQLSEKIKSKVLEILVAISTKKSRVVLISATAKGGNPLTLATWLAANFTAPGRKVGVLYLGDDLSFVPRGAERGELLGLTTAAVREMDLLFAKEGSETARILSSGVVDNLVADDAGLYDLLIVVATEGYVLAAARGLAKHHPFKVALTKRGRTEKALLTKLVSIQPLDANVSLTS